MAMVIHQEPKTIKLLDKLQSIHKQYDDGLLKQLDMFHQVDKACFDYLEDKKIIFSRNIR